MSATTNLASAATAQGRSAAFTINQCDSAA